MTLPAWPQPVLATLVAVTVLLSFLWLLLRHGTKTALREEKEWVDDRAHRVVSVRLDMHNADPNAHPNMHGVERVELRLDAVQATLHGLLGGQGEIRGALERIEGISTGFVCPLGKKPYVSKLCPDVPKDDEAGG